jgi:hypothetical protein
MIAVRLLAALALLNLAVLVADLVYNLVGLLEP